MATPAEEQNWDLVIEPPKGWFDLHLRDLWQSTGKPFSRASGYLPENNRIEV